jgi:hypothetical protein
VCLSTLPFAPPRAYITPPPPPPQGRDITDEDLARPIAEVGIGADAHVTARTLPAGGRFTRLGGHVTRVGPLAVANRSGAAWLGGFAVLGGDAPAADVTVVRVAYTGAMCAVGACDGTHEFSPRTKMSDPVPWSLLTLYNGWVYAGGAADRECHRVAWAPAPPTGEVLVLIDRRAFAVSVVVGWRRFELPWPQYHRQDPFTSSNDGAAPNAAHITPCVYIPSQNSGVRVTEIYHGRGAAARSRSRVCRVSCVVTCAWVLFEWGAVCARAARSRARSRALRAVS